MNGNRVFNRWPVFKDEIKAQWEYLSEEHIDEVVRRFDPLRTKIQQKYGLANGEAHKQINTW